MDMQDREYMHGNSLFVFSYVLRIKDDRSRIGGIYELVEFF